MPPQTLDRIRPPDTKITKFCFVRIIIVLANSAFAFDPKLYESRMRIPAHHPMRREGLGMVASCPSKYGINIEKEPPGFIYLNTWYMLQVRYAGIKLFTLVTSYSLIKRSSHAVKPHTRASFR